MSKMQESNGIKEKFFTKKNIIFVISLVLIVIVFVLFDQITKILAIRYLTGKGEVPFLGDLLVFNLVYNKGAAWGMGGDNLFTRILLVIISWLVAVGIIGYFIYLVIKRKEIKYGFWIILSFILAGDIGNLIDRTFFFNREQGSVVDFLSIQRWWPKFGIFNVADAILVCSIFALLIYFIVELVKEEIEKHKKVEQKLKNDSIDQNIKNKDE